MITYAVQVEGALFNTNLSNEMAIAIAHEVSELGAIGQRLVVQGAPRGVASGGGGLRGSIHTSLRGSPVPREAIVATSLVYGPIVEGGRRPGARAPSSRHLLLWVRRKLGVPANRAPAVAFLVARAIGRQGIPAVRMFEKASAHIQALMPGRTAALGSKLARMAGGRG